MQRRRPLLWAVFALALGILLGRGSEPSAPLISTLWVIGAMVTTVWLGLSLWRNWAHGAALLLTLIALGAALYLQARFPAERLYEYADRYQPIRGTVINYPDHGPTRTRFLLKPHDAPGYLQVFYDHRSESEPLRVNYGDEIFLRVSPRAPRNFSGFDYRDYLRRRDIWGVVQVRRASEIELVAQRRGYALLQMGYDLRRALFARLESLLAPAHSALLKGLLFGERESLPREIEASFREAGVMHVLVASGANLGMILSLFALLLSFWGFNFTRLYILAGPVVLLYLLVVGFEPSLVRATLMFFFLTLGFFCAERGWLLKRWADPLQGLALAALLILLLEPEALFEASFQLSFAGTFGILIAVLYLWPWLQKRLKLEPLFPSEELWWRKIARWVLIFVLVSLAAQLCVAPIIAYHFQRIYLWSALLGNLIIVPLATVALWGGIALLIVSPIPFLAEVLAIFAGAWLQLLISLSEFFAGL